MNTDSIDFLSLPRYQKITSCQSGSSSPQRNADSQVVEHYLKYNQDSSEKGFDEQILLSMILKEKDQYCTSKVYSKLCHDEIQKIQSIFLNYSYNKFDYDHETSSQLPGFLKVKLLTLKFLEVAILNQESDNIKNIDFMIHCATNMALKSYSLLISMQDIQNYIQAQPEKSQDFWNKEILKFENFMFENLNWNIDLITSSDFFNYFLENHFNELLISGYDEQLCDNFIIICFCELKWSSMSIAIACLAYFLNDDQSNYLQYLIHKYKYEFSQHGKCFDETEINEITDFIEQLIQAETENDQTSEQQNTGSSSQNYTHNNSNDQDSDSYNRDEEYENKDDEDDHSENNQQNSSNNKNQQTQESYPQNTYEQNQSQQQQSQQDHIQTQNLNACNDSEEDEDIRMEAEEEDLDDASTISNDNLYQESEQTQSRKASVSSSYSSSNRESYTYNKKRSATEYCLSHKHETTKIERKVSVSDYNSKTEIKNRYSSKSFTHQSIGSLNCSSIFQYNNQEDINNDNCLGQLLDEQIFENGYKKKIYVYDN